MMNPISKQIIECFERKGKVISFGCGGLAAESLHMTGEFLGHMTKDRRPLPAISLCADIATTTAIANDYGFDQIFSRQVEALAKPEDIVIGLSTSGRSRCIINGLEQARTMNVQTIDFPREGVGTPNIQENMLRLIHQIAQEVEDYFA